MTKTPDCEICGEQMVKQTNKKSGKFRFRCVDCKGPKTEVFGLALPKQVMEILSRWAECGFYVYIRAMSSKYDQPSQEHRLIWNVSVEYRAVHPGSWRMSGPELSSLISTLDRTVPKSRNPKDRLDIRENPGWLATDTMQERAIKHRRKKRTGAKR